MLGKWEKKSHKKSQINSHSSILCIYCFSMLACVEVIKLIDLMRMDDGFEVGSKVYIHFLLSFS